jgi:Guanylylate cyclase
VKSACALRDLVQRVQAESVWTIDLAYLFASYGIRAQLFTINPGVDPSYSEEVGSLGNAWWLPLACCIETNG